MPREGGNKDPANSTYGAREPQMSDMETTKPGDEAPLDQPGVGENVCPECGGSGELNGKTCEACAGEGTVAEGISGA